MFEKEQVEKAVEKIVSKLAQDEKISNLGLLEICRKQGIESVAGDNDVHLAHEILEVAVNKYVSTEYDRNSIIPDIEGFGILAALERLEKQISTQSWRSGEQQNLQQFSTPPGIAFLMAKILNPSEKDFILEPSAGTGSLAVWLKMADCRLHLNELSARRRVLLEIQGYKPTGYNAEFLDDFLPEEIKPDGVLMNPPFSSSAGRTKTNDSNYGFRHVRSALSRLKPGGRLVALLGTESATKTDKARFFWNEIAQEFDLRAIIHLPKNAFYKYGTTTATSIFCVVKKESSEATKRGEKRSAVLEAGCRTLEECLKYADVFD